MNIEKLNIELSVTERQWAGIAVLTELAQVSLIDIGIRIVKTESFQNFLNCDINSNEIGDSLSAARARNSRDSDVYFRPSRGQQASVIMLDDVNLEAALNLADGKSHMLIETSPKNYQLWLKTDRMLTEAERKAVQSHLALQHGGDVGSSSGEHYGRICGFKNRKPQYDLPWVNLSQYSLDGDAIDVRQALAPALPSSKLGACVLEYGTSQKLLAISRGADGCSGESHREFKYACESLRRNVSRQIIILNIADRALQRGKRRSADGCLKYANLTVEKAEEALVAFRNI